MLCIAYLLCYVNKHQEKKIISLNSIDCVIFICLLSFVFNSVYCFIRIYVTFINIYIYSW